MALQVHRVELREIEGMRDIYRHEMNCQIIHDSVHARPGWTHEYLLTESAAKVMGSSPRCLPATPSLPAVTTTQGKRLESASAAVAAEARSVTARSVNCSASIALTTSRSTA